MNVYYLNVYYFTNLTPFLNLAEKFTVVCPHHAWIISQCKYMIYLW